jgi:hypothetical protein
LPVNTEHGVIIDTQTGTDVMILKIFSQKNWRKNWHFLQELLLVFEKKLIITLVLEKNANFFRRK